MRRKCRVCGELCKRCNPSWPQPAAVRATMFRETFFRGMDVPKGSRELSVRLDAIDRKILKELQADGRMTNVELARRVGISAPPCLRRVRALEEAGFLKGYRA